MQDQLKELQSNLMFADAGDPSPRRSGASIQTEILLFRRQHLVLRMRAEANHQRAHFHIEYKKEHQASYAVDTLEMLAGNMPAKYEREILPWAKRNKKKLFRVWAELNAGNDPEIKWEVKSSG